MANTPGAKKAARKIARRTEINKAHVLMLLRCGIIDVSVARQLAKAVVDLQEMGPEGFSGRLTPYREYDTFKASNCISTGAWGKPG